MRHLCAALATALLCATAATAATTVTPPYSPTFTSSSDLSDFTIIDANADGNTWKYASEGLLVTLHGGNASDDWLITPGINLEQSKVYKLTFDVYNGIATTLESLEVKLGSTASVRGMTDTIIAQCDVTGTYNSNQTMRAYITADTDGVYYIGWHSMSENTTYGLYLSNISITEAGIALAPAEPTGLTATADPDGAYTATLQFTAPSCDAKGNTLASLSKIRVVRDGVSVYSVTSPVPGQTYTYTSSVPLAGTYTYLITASNDYGDGLTAQISVFIGMNTPGAVTSLKVTEQADSYGTVTLTWDAPDTDCDGKTIKSGDIKYTVVRVLGDYLTTSVATELSSNSYTYQAVDPDTTQSFIQWAVYGTTEGGSGTLAYTDMVPVGTPFSSPYTESFAGGALSHTMLMVVHSGSAAWEVCSDGYFSWIDSQDGDGGFSLMYSTQAGDSASIISSKIEISGDNPGMSLYVYLLDDTLDDSYYIGLRTLNSDEWVTVGQIKMNGISPGTGWRYVNIPMPDYSGKVVQVRITAATQGAFYHPIDNILIGSLPTNDLAVAAITAQSRADAGVEFDISIDVDNHGTTTASGYTVDLYRDGTLIASADGDDLESSRRVTVTMTDILDANAPDTVAYYATVSLAADSDGSNDTSDTVYVKLITNDYPTVTSLSVQETDQGATLSWNAPSLDTSQPDAVTESFEDYDGYSSELGQWTLIDADQAGVASLFSGIPGKSKQSFWVLDASEFNSTYAACSGSKLLVSIYREDWGLVDDWIVSPELYGSQQTITFWAKRWTTIFPETLQVLYSTGGTDIDDFTLADEATFSSLTAEWTQYSVTLPEGAKRFAIRSYQSKNFMVMVDDITYIPVGEAGLEISGYNIYRDGQKITSQPVAQTAYTDTGFTGEVTQYAVSVVYSAGESPLSDPVYTGSGSVGCTTLQENQSPPDWYNLQGIKVDITAAPPGIYIKRQGSTATKVRVE